MSSAELDRIRAAALERVERAERHRKAFLVATAMVEGVFLVLFVLLADWQDRLHVLVFLAACLVYMTLGLGIFSLWAHVNVCTQRLLRAIELAANGGREGHG